MLAGLVPGVAVGIAGALVVAAHEDVDGGRLVRDALGGDAVLALVVLVATLWILLAAVLRTSEGPLRKGIRATDIAAVVLAAVALLAASRGNATAARLGEQGDPLLALLPALVAGAGGLAAMRLVGPALAAWRGSRRPLRRWPASGRRCPAAPARPLATVAFLVAACALAIFATTYRSTLRTGAADQAAFAVPLDARLVSGPSLDAAARPRVDRGYRELADGGYATPVVRRSAVVRTAGTAPDPVQLVGLDPDALPRIARFRSDTRRRRWRRARRRRLPGRRRPVASRRDRAAPRRHRHRGHSPSPPSWRDPTASREPSRCPGRSRSGSAAGGSSAC